MDKASIDKWVAEGVRSGKAVVRDMVNGHLRIYPDDDDDLVIVGRDPDSGEFKGWIQAGKGKQPKNWCPTGEPPPRKQ